MTNRVKVCQRVAFLHDLDELGLPLGVMLSVTAQLQHPCAQAIPRLLQPGPGFVLSRGAVHTVCEAGDGQEGGVGGDNERLYSVRACGRLASAVLLRTFLASLACSSRAGSAQRCESVQEAMRSNGFDETLR